MGKASRRKQERRGVIQTIYCPSQKGLEERLEETLALRAELAGYYAEQHPYVKAFCEHHRMPVQKFVAWHPQGQQFIRDMLVQIQVESEKSENALLTRLEIWRRRLIPILEKGGDQR